MVYGFTGTRKGMTERQKKAFRELIQSHEDGYTTIDEFHHGCCVGADADAHWLIRNVEPCIFVVGHPATTKALQDKRVVADCDLLYAVKPPLDRNPDIVRESTAMIACPGEAKERRRGSGTWATIRESSRQDKPLTIILPDGKILR